MPHKQAKALTYNILQLYQLLKIRLTVSNEHGQEMCLRQLCCGYNNYMVLLRKPEMSSVSRLSFMNLATVASHLIVTRIDFQF